MMLKTISLLATIITVNARGISYSDTASSQFCSPGESCWPKQQDIDALYNALEPHSPRNWKNIAKETPAGPVIEGKGLINNDQPIFGHGVDMNPLYVNDDIGRVCFENRERSLASIPETNQFCYQSMRNFPYTTGKPAFVAW